MEEVMKFKKKYQVDQSAYYFYATIDFAETIMVNHRRSL